jgi:hypothetical protein
VIGGSGAVVTQSNSNGSLLRFTIEDEGVFTTPWTATMTYVRDPDGWSEMVCAENIQWYSGKEAEVPRTDKPDL